MRADNLKRNLKRHVAVKSKYPKISCTICRKIIIRNNLARDMKVYNVLQNSDLSVSELRDEVSKKMYNRQNTFTQKLKNRRVRSWSNVEPMSLSKDYKEALELYEDYNSDVQIITSILKP